MRWALTLRRACPRAASAGRYSCRARPCRCTCAGKTKDLTKAMESQPGGTAAQPRWRGALFPAACVATPSAATRASASTSGPHGRAALQAWRLREGPRCSSLLCTRRRVHSGVQPYACAECAKAFSPARTSPATPRSPCTRRSTVATSHSSAGTSPRPSTAARASPSTRGRTRATSP